MKIGIITTYFAYNFGAMLQPFALKRTLESLGHEVEMIRYKQEAVYNYYAPFNFKRLLSKNPLAVLRNIHNLLKYYNTLKMREQNFQKFLLKHITDSISFTPVIPSDKDVYFVGSDQLWNPYNLGGFDDIYMGNFSAKQGSVKATYAISAGSLKFTNNNINYIKENLKNFDYISVREDSLREDLIKYVGYKDAETVLDPTLLAEPSIYDEIQITNPLPADDFIMLYYIRDCASYLKKLCDYANKNRLRLLVLSEGVKEDVKLLAKKNACINYIPEAGEDIFLGGIKNAKCIFTPSFHGVAFSIIFHRPFYSLELADNNNRRAQDLLKMVGLSNRVLTLSQKIPVNISIDFSTCDDVILIEREKSLQFIRKVVNSYKS